MRASAVCCLTLAQIMIAVVAGSAIFAPRPVFAAEVAAPSAVKAAPFIVKRQITNTEVEPSGATTTRYTQEIQITNEAGVAQLGTAVVPFRENRDTLEIEEAYTLKADGRRILVDPSRIFTQAAAKTSFVFDTARQKVIIFPDVSVGDSIVLSAKLTSLPQYRGTYYVRSMYPAVVEYQDVSFTVTAPVSMPLTFDTVGGKVESRTTGETTTYVWRHGGKTAAPSAASAYFAVSSFSDYDAVGRAYADLIKGMDAATPAVQAKADEITRGITDRRAQAARLYDWVSQNIRYVAIDIGLNAAAPFDPDSTLANGYGDCKGKAMLLAALLRAKGISSEQVLIYMGGRHALAELPSPEQFNHVILWIPEFEMYADPTAETAEFGTLPFAGYGKPVVHVMEDGTRVASTPILAPGVATSRVTTITFMDFEGNIASENTITGTGPIATNLRSLSKTLRAGAEQLGPRTFRSTGERGNGSYELQDDSGLVRTYTMKGRFQDNYGTGIVARGATFHMPPGLRAIARVGERYMGPFYANAAQEAADIACYNVAQIEEFTFHPPPGFSVTKLPADAEIKTANIDFTARWSRSGRSITVVRDFKSNVTEPQCTGETRARVAEAIRAIAKDYAQTISIARAISAPAEKLITPDEMAEFDADVRAHPSNHIPVANRAIAHSINKKFELSIRDFDTALKLHPNYLAYLGRGMARVMQRNDPQSPKGRASLLAAIDDLSQAIRLDPRNSTAYGLRAQAKMALKQPDEALADLNEAVVQNENPLSLASRGYVLVQQKKYQEAIADFDRALALKPNEPKMLEYRGVAYHAAGHYENALADFLKVRELVPNHPEIESLIADAEKKR